MAQYTKSGMTHVGKVCHVDDADEHERKQQQLQQDQQQQQQRRRRRQALIENNLKWNKFIIKLTLYGISLEVALQRFAFKNALVRVWIARIRFLLFAWITLKMVVAIVFHDCEYSRARANMWDWTIYYPVAARTNLLRCFVAMCSYHLCVKFMVFFERPKPYDSSLLDFLTSSPPSPYSQQQPQPSQPSSKSFQSSITSSTSSTVSRSADDKGGDPHQSLDDTGGEQQAVKHSKLKHLYGGELSASTNSYLELDNYLRDEQHWLELSSELRKAFKRILWSVLSVNLFVLLSASARVAFLLQSQRACDIERPFLRLAGLIELNFLLIECILTFVGTFTFCSLIKLDLRLQAQRVELYLAWVKQLRTTSKKSKGRDQVWASAFNPGHKSSSEIKHSQAGIAKFSDYAGVKQQQQQQGLFRYLDERSYAQLMSGYGDNYNNNKDWYIIRPRRYAGATSTIRKFERERDYIFEASAQVAPAEYSYSEGNFKQKRKQYRDDHGRKQQQQQRQSEVLAQFICEAQLRVTLFLKCIDSHKPAISRLGSAMLIWLLAGLSWVPVLFTGYKGEIGGRDHVIYIVSCGIAVMFCLTFMFICAEVYDRGTRLSGRIFSVCAAYHSEPVAHNWNQILLIWFSPNRCAFKIGDFLQLTYLNILKSLSFLVSGLTFIISCIGD